MLRLAMSLLGLWVLGGFFCVSLNAQSQSTRASAISLIKNTAYSQTSASGVTLLTFEIKSRVVLVDPPTVPFGGTLESPGGRTDEYIRVGNDILEFNQNYVSAELIDRTFPFGSYVIRLKGPLATTYGFTHSAAERPAPAVIANFDALQSIATPDRVTISWATIPGGLATDIVILAIQSDDQTFFYNSLAAGVALSGRSTELTLGLPPGKRLTAELLVLRGRITPNGPLSWASTTGVSASTRFSLATRYPLPTISVQPTTQSVASDNSVVLSVGVTGIGPLTYQWRRNGTDIRGAIEAMLRLDNVQAADAGSYSVIVSNPGGSVTSDAAVLTVAVNARMINLATRGQAGREAGELIAGFVLGGTGSKTVLIRAIGPGLTDFGLAASEVLADPVLVVGSGVDVVARNDDWEQNDLAPLRAATTAVGAFALRPNSRDAAILLRLPAGAYTASVASKDASMGVAIVEVYDLDAPGAGLRLINLATRASVGPGAQILIPGFVVSGDTPRKYLLRGAGPALAEFGVTGFLPDPVLTLFRGSTSVYSNDDWSSDPNAAETLAIAARVGAFSLRANSTDAAFVVELAPGAYTFQLAGKGDTSGVALVEVYEIR